MNDNTKREAYEIVLYDIYKCVNAPICPDRAKLKQVVRVLEDHLYFYEQQAKEQE